MSDEQFIEKYEELLNKGYCDCNEMNCLDNDVPTKILNIVKGTKLEAKQLLEENQELKKQLEVGEQQYNDLVEEKENLQEQLSNSHQINAQQKEFIEWLEERIKATEDKLTKYNELVIQGKETDTEYYLSIIDERELDTYEKVLSKYKELIGGSND